MTRRALQFGSLSRSTALWPRSAVVSSLQSPHHYFGLFCDRFDNRDSTSHIPSDGRGYFRDRRQHEKVGQMDTVSGAWLRLVAYTLIAAVVKRCFVVARVSGESMTPTLRNDECVVGIRIPRRQMIPWSLTRKVLLARGTIVLACPPECLRRLVVKRIDALPGDVRQWGWASAVIGPCPIPDNHIFLIGDASRDTGLSMGPAADSRLYGPCPSEAILARVFLRCWPLERCRWLM